MKIVILFAMIQLSFRANASSCDHTMPLLTRMLGYFVPSPHPDILVMGLRQNADIKWALNFLAELEGEESKKLIAAAKSIQIKLRSTDSNAIGGETPVGVQWYLKRAQVSQAKQISLFQMRMTLEGEGAKLQMINPSIFSLIHELTHAVAFSDLSPSHFQNVTWPEKSHDFYSLYRAFYDQSIFDEVRALESEIFLERAYQQKYGESLALQQFSEREREHLKGIILLYEKDHGQQNLINYIEHHYLHYKIIAAQLALLHFLHLPLELEKFQKKEHLRIHNCLAVIQQKLAPHLQYVEFDWPRFVSTVLNQPIDGQDKFLQEKFDQHLQIINQVLSQSPVH